MLKLAVLKSPIGQVIKPESQSVPRDVLVFFVNNRNCSCGTLVIGEIEEDRHMTLLITHMYDPTPLPDLLLCSTSDRSMEI
ncbi:hypothetical protein WN944_001403 [Citrus x changshan-huyou]|uniref:Uncharacterized protein n=1 Tax=Citrus x changshan-huyou TaxID=2935761 RepID=A0AAP0MEM8_9ROSI